MKKIVLVFACCLVASLVACGGSDEKVIDGTTSLSELAEYAEKLGRTSEPQSGRQEYLESIINSIMFSC